MWQWFFIAWNVVFALSISFVRRNHEKNIRSWRDSPQTFATLWKISAITSGNVVWQVHADVECIVMYEEINPISAPKRLTAIQKSYPLFCISSI